jgi:hypothetical protein
MYFVPEGQHDRSHSTRYRLLMAGLARSAWKGAQRENHPVGYGMIGHSYLRHPRSISRRECGPYCRIGNLVMPIINRCARPRESDRTLRDGSFGWRCPSHFVPGYDRTVPLGQKPPRVEGLALG